MFDNNTEDFKYSFTLSKTDLINIGLIQEHLSSAGYGDYDEDGYCTVCNDCYLNFNTVVQEALASTANLLQRQMWEDQRKGGLLLEHSEEC